MLYVVATPIGNLNDMSKRAIDTLKEVDLILAEDTRNTIKLLNHFGIKNKMESYHKFNEEEKSETVIKRMKEGLKVALVCDAGTPCISDPGYVLVSKARKEDVEVFVIPGPSASISALSISGLDTSSFSFYGFVPTSNKGRKDLFERLRQSDIETKVLYESPKRILKLLQDLDKEIPGCVVLVCAELTKLHEKSVFGFPRDIYDKMKDDPNTLKGEYVVVLNNKKQEIKNLNVSIEALIVNEMISGGLSIKEAVNKLNNDLKDVSKKDIYNASLNLKNLF